MLIISEKVYIADPETCDILPSEHIMKNLIFSSIIYTIYGTIFVIGLLSNMMICYMVMKSPTMRTVTNYFIMNLAVTDILMLLSGLYSSISVMLQYWPFEAFMCSLVSYVTYLSVFVSTYTLVVIGIDNWMSIKYPFKQRTTKRFAAYIISFVWIFAGITILPVGMVTQIYQPTSAYEICDRYICIQDYAALWEPYGTIYTIMLMVLTQIVPLVVLLLIYTNMAFAIWRFRIPECTENHTDGRITRSKSKMIKITKMMAIVVLAFTMCLLPYNLYVLLSVHIAENIKPYVYFFVYGLAMSHTCWNPVVYCCMDIDFRDGLFLILETVPYFKKRYFRKTHDSLSFELQPQSLPPNKETNEETNLVRSGESCETTLLGS